MRHLFTSLSLLILCACAEPQKQVETAPEAQSVPVKSCDKSVNYGRAHICLPSIQGMNECYDHPQVKIKANSLEYEGNSVLAIYLNDAIYKQVDKIKDIDFGEYFKIYATDITKDQEFTESGLDEFSKMFESNFLKENWSQVQSKVNEKHTNLKVGVPVLIETINERDHVRTYMMLTRYQIDNTFYDVAIAANAIIIDKTLSWLAYYNEYKNDKTIASLKAKNAKVIYELLKANGL